MGKQKSIILAIILVCFIYLFFILFLGCCFLIIHIANQLSSVPFYLSDDSLDQESQQCLHIL